MINHVEKSAILIGRVMCYSIRICIVSVISYVKVASSFITIREGKKCLLQVESLALKSTMLPIRNIVINVNHMNGIILYLSKMEISIYYVKNVLGSHTLEEQRNGWYKRYQEGTIVNLSIGYTIHNKLYSKSLLNRLHDVTCQLLYHLVIRYNVYILKDSKNSNCFLVFRECR